MNPDTWYVLTSITIIALGLTAIVFAFKLDRLVRTLEDAVILIFESKVVNWVDLEEYNVAVDCSRFASNEACFQARKIIRVARLFHKRWFRKTLKEYVVKLEIDGVHIQ